jgi:hypothetical protein
MVHVIFQIKFIELKLNYFNWMKWLSATSTDLETTKTNLASTRTELLNSTKSAMADLVTHLNGKNILNEFFYKTRLK